MQEDYSNIYARARRTAGLTQERWAEAIGCSVESVRLYESGRGLPSDDIVLRMADVSGMQMLCAQYMRAKSVIGAMLVPEIKECSLPLAVVQLIKRINDFADRHRTDDLIDIADDGRIDQAEQKTFDAIVAELDGIVGAAMQLRYAKEEYNGSD